MKTNNVLGFLYEHSINKIMKPNQHVFDFYSIENKNRLGTLVCHKSKSQIRPNYDGSVLAVDYIEVTNKNQGIGTKILNFAEKFSMEEGCKGFMTLKADCFFTPEKIPHIFYRKFGFSTLDDETDKKLDKFIKQNANATKNDFPCLLMHYPKEKKESIFKRIFSFFKQLIKA